MALLDSTYKTFCRRTWSIYCSSTGRDFSCSSSCPSERVGSRLSSNACIEDGTSTTAHVITYLDVPDLRLYYQSYGPDPRITGTQDNTPTMSYEKCRDEIINRCE
jgi:hypothetical protein